jgi:hypothetical protein
VRGTLVGKCSTRVRRVSFPHFSKRKSKSARQEKYRMSMYSCRNNAQRGTP